MNFQPPDNDDPRDDAQRLEDAEAPRLKRFLLFAGANYYPQGGMDDFVADHHTVQACWMSDEAKTAVGHKAHYWAHVYDTVQRKVIWTSHAGRI